MYSSQCGLQTCMLGNLGCCDNGRSQASSPPHPGLLD